MRFNQTIWSPLFSCDLNIYPLQVRTKLPFLMYWQLAKLTFLPDIFKVITEGKILHSFNLYQFHIHLIHNSFIPAVYIILKWIAICPDIIYCGGGESYNMRYLEGMKH